MPFGEDSAVVNFDVFWLTFLGVACAAFVGFVGKVTYDTVLRRRVRRRSSEEDRSKSQLSDRQLLEKLSTDVELIKNGRDDGGWGRPAIVGLKQLGQQVSNLRGELTSKVEEAQEDIRRIDRTMEEEVFPKMHIHSGSS